MSIDFQKGDVDPNRLLHRVVDAERGRLPTIGRRDISQTGSMGFSGINCPEPERQKRIVLVVVDSAGITEVVL